MVGPRGIRCGLVWAYGTEGVKKIAAWAAASGVRVGVIRHSGKLRAEQTAEIIAAALKPGGEPQATLGLNPNDDVRPIAKLLDSEEHTVMLVGHLPFLGRLVSQLVVGNLDQAIVAFDAGALVRLSQRSGRWVVDCVVQPGTEDSRPKSPSRNARLSSC